MIMKTTIMKTTLLVLSLACVIARPVSAETPDDGMYVLSDAPDAKKVPGQGERAHGLGEKRAYETMEARVVSQNNLNSEFRLQLKVPFAEGLVAILHVLVVKGKAYGQSDGGSDANKSCSPRKSR